MKKPSANKSAAMSGGDPFRFQHKGPLNSWVDFRLLSRENNPSEDEQAHVVKFMQIWVPNPDKFHEDPTAVIPVNDNGDPELLRIITASGFPIAHYTRKHKDQERGAPRNMVRIPVFVHRYYNPEKSQTPVEVNKTMYMEVSPQVIGGIEKLDAEGKHPTVSRSNSKYLKFDPETGIPNYDMRLEVIKGTGTAPNYSIVPLIEDEIEEADGVRKVVRPGVGLYYFEDKKGSLNKFKAEMSEDWPKVIASINHFDSTEEAERRVRKGLLDGPGSISTKPELNVNMDAADEEEDQTSQVLTGDEVVEDYED